MADGPRARKLADRIHEVVARTLDTRVKDPRLGFVTITEVRVTGDLQHATIFYTVLGSDEERAASAAALDSAKGMLRTEVGKATRVRLTPSLEFVADALPETAATLEDALRRAAERDAAIAAQAAGATYAGDADPYRKADEGLGEDDVDGEPSEDGEDGEDGYDDEDGDFGLDSEDAAQELDLDGTIGDTSDLHATEDGAESDEAAQAGELPLDERRVGENDEA